MHMRIAGMIQESIVDGPGLRFVLFTQGCPHRCPGCHNLDTHDPEGGREVTTDEIIREMLSNPLTDGLTLSGGEPFAQPDACTEIAVAAKAAGLNVWCYTGYHIEDLLEIPAYRRLLETVDILVDGEFIEAERTLTLKWRGSRNQRVLTVAEFL